MLFGLSIGLGVALVVYLKSGAPLLPASTMLAAERGAAATAADPIRATAPAAGEAVAAGEAAAAAETVAATGIGTASEAATAARTEANTTAEPAPGLAFYDRLAELRVNIPEAATRADRAEVSPGSYKIQAGSFRTVDEADSRTARLALLGIESAIESAIVNDQIWHRVIIGPLSDVAEINRVRRKLREERIDALAPQLVAD